MCGKFEKRVRTWLITNYLLLIMWKLAISIAIFYLKQLVKKKFCRSQNPHFTKEGKRMQGLSINCWRSNGLMSYSICLLCKFYHVFLFFLKRHFHLKKRKIKGTVVWKKRPYLTSLQIKRSFELSFFFLPLYKFRLIPKFRVKSPFEKWCALAAHWLYHRDFTEYYFTTSTQWLPNR